MAHLNPAAPMRADQAADRLSAFDLLQVLLIAIYISIAGIFWLGPISFVAISTTKLILFAIVVALGVLRGQHWTREQAALLIAMAVCSLAAFLTNVATGTIDDAVESARSFAEPILWLIALIGVRPVAYRMLFRLLIIGLAAFVALAFYPVLAFADFVPNLSPPAGFVSPAAGVLDNDAFQSQISVIAGGFNGSRTGWGSSVSQSALMLVALVTMSRQVSNRQLFLSLFVVAVAVAGIVVTGARGGSLSLIVLAVYALIARFRLSVGQRTAVIFFSVLAVVGIIILGVTVVLPQDYFRGFGRSDSTFDALDAATTGRFHTYVGAIDNFIRSPVFGVGAADSAIRVPSGEYLLPHNLWLRYLSESGLVLIVPLLVVTTLLVRILVRRMRALNVADLVRERLPDTSLVVICGLVLALSEPAVIFGSMNANIPFWTALWVLTVPFAIRDGWRSPRSGTPPA